MFISKMMSVKKTLLVVVAFGCLIEQSAVAQKQPTLSQPSGAEVSAAVPMVVAHDDDDGAGSVQQVQAAACASCFDGMCNWIGVTPLLLAANSGHVECVKLLLARPGVDVNARVGNDWMPLQLAAANGYVECVNLLLAHPGVDVNARVGADRLTPLHFAVMNSYPVCVEALLAHSGVDVNARTARGSTPLHLAAAKGYVDCVGKLLTHGADWQLTDIEDGQTAADVICRDCCDSDRVQRRTLIRNLIRSAAAGTLLQAQTGGGAGSSSK